MANEILFPVCGLLVAVGVWFLKLCLRKWIEREVNHQYDVKLEDFKAKLAIVATERQLRFSHVYSETVKVIHKFYQMLIECDRQAHAFMNEEEDEDQAWEIVEKSEEELADFWIMNHLYFPV